MDRPSKNILEEKKKKFLVEVDTSADYLGVKVNEVKFWEVYDSSHFRDGERAHIHLDEKKICIAESELKKMTFDEIRETANHEVSHLKHAGHDTDFQETLEQTNAGDWLPPSGVMHINGNNRRRVEDYKPEKEKNGKPSCGECSNKKDIILCDYCGRYFCSKHKNPRMPYIGQYTDLERDDTPNSHPCLGYAKYKKEEKEKQDEEYRQTLDKMCRRKNSFFESGNKTNYSHYKNNAPQRSYENNEEEFDELPGKPEIRSRAEGKFCKKCKETVYNCNVHLNTSNPKTHGFYDYYCKNCNKYLRRKDIEIPKNKKENKKMIGWIIFIIILAIIGILIYINLPKIYYSLAGNPNFGGIINNPLENKEISDFMFNKLNNYRVSKQVSSLSYDKGAYNLAIFASKYYNEKKLMLSESGLALTVPKYKINDVRILYLTATTMDLGRIQLEVWEQNEIISGLLINKNYSLGSIGCFKEICAVVFANDLIILQAREKIVSKNDTSTIATDLNGAVDSLVSKLGSIFSSETGEKIKEVSSGAFEDIKDTVTVPERDYDFIENRIFELVNEERNRQGASALRSNVNLNSYARSWSEKMISENFFEHSNLNFAYYSIAGENIAETPIHYNVVGCGSTYSNEAMAQCFVTGWIESPGHHKNMISRSFSMTGVGIACDSSKCRATQVFSG